MASRTGNPLVYCADGTGEQAMNYFTMRRLSEIGDRELEEAVKEQGLLIGNLENEKTRMRSRYLLLDGELSRRIQAGTFGGARGTERTPGTAQDSRAEGTAEREEREAHRRPSSSREPSQAGRRSEGRSRWSGNRPRSRSQRSGGMLQGAKAKATSRAWEPDAAAGKWEPTIFHEACLGVPEPPRVMVNPHQAPLDSRESGASTVHVGNISWGTTELEVLELFNSVDGVFRRRESNIVIAVNFVYWEGNFRGHAFLLYSTAALAEFVVRRLHNRELRGRMLSVRISDRRFDTANLGRYGHRRGASRCGEQIWDVDLAPWNTRPPDLGGGAEDREVGNAGNRHSSR